MTPSRRQRMIDAVWPALEKLPAASKVDRSLRGALVAPTSSTGTGTVHIVSTPSISGLRSGDDLVIERSLPQVALDQLLPRPSAPDPAVVAAVTTLVEDWLALERDLLSHLVHVSTEQIESAPGPFPSGLMLAVQRARVGLKYQGPLDLLLTPRHHETLIGSEHKDAVEHALRGGAVLIATGQADGLLIPHLPGPVTFGEIDPLRLDWDVAGDDVRLIVWERLRFFSADPRAQAVNLVLTP